MFETHLSSDFGHRRSILQHHALTSPVKQVRFSCKTFPNFEARDETSTEKLFVDLVVTSCQRSCLVMASGEMSLADNFEVALSLCKDKTPVF
jgi:hypothetical protein